LTDAAPVAVYLHWPYCARICPYCDFNVVRDRGQSDEQTALAAAMTRDLEVQAERLGPRRLVSVFFGGGTPSLMDPDAAGRLVETARRLFPSAAPVEVTLEANPTDAEAARFRAFAGAGVQRLSLGLQSLDDKALAFLGRNHSAAEGRRAAEAARAAFPRLSIDLIYARPGQTPDAWRAELGEGLELGAEHLSPYQLTIEAGTAFGRQVERGRWRPPDGDLGADLWDVTQTSLAEAGFDAYEVSNHARGEAARSAHNLAVWRGAEYLGVGPGAHGRIEIDGGRAATRAARGIGDYLGRVAANGVGWDTFEALDRIAAAEERLLLGLRIREGVPLVEVAALGLDPAATRIADLAGAGLIHIDAHRIAATDAGRLVLDGVLAELIA
jgi:oxygen-independent coproporphyrinogen-3 oxidase